MVSPRYIPADDMFSRVVVVFRDDLVGATAIVVPVPSPATEAAMNVSEDEVMKMVALQQFMHPPAVHAPADHRHAPGRGVTRAPERRVVPAPSRVNASEQGIPPAEAGDPELG